MKFLRKILKGVSLTGAIFVFQACYGTRMPMPLYEEGGEAPMRFSLVSKADGSPLEGIRILGVAAQYTDAKPLELGITGADGRCTVKIPYGRNRKGPYVTFEDPDGQFLKKDTLLTDLREREIEVKLVPEL